MNITDELYSGGGATGNWSTYLNNSIAAGEDGPTNRTDGGGPGNAQPAYASYQRVVVTPCGVPIMVRIQSPSEYAYDAYVCVCV